MKAFRNYMLILLVLTGLSSTYLVKRYDSEYPREIRPRFDPLVRRKYLEAVDQLKPDAVFIGDSMLNPAVDTETLGRKLNLSFAAFGMPGSASTLWYLIIKNNILEAKHPPKYLFILFRDSMMTVPGYRVTGRYFEQIDEYASPKDGVLIQRAYLDLMNPLEKLGEAYLPLYGLRWDVRTQIDSTIRYAGPRFILGCDKPCMDNAMEVTFGAMNIDLVFLNEAIAAADDYLYSRTALNFDRQVDDSFLPEIIRLCKERDIQLVLVHMRILRFVKPGSEPPALRAYNEAMTRYLAENGVIYLDYSQEGSLTQEYYDDTVHMNKAGQAIFTDMLAEDLLKVLK